MRRIVEKPCQVVMAGVDFKVMGGITSVVLLYREAGLFDPEGGNVRYLATTADGHPVYKIYRFVQSLIQFPILLLCNPAVQLIHIHMASYGSFVRKALLATIGRLFGKKVILHVHGADFITYFEEAPGLGKKIIRYVMRSAESIIGLSHQWKVDLDRVAGRPLTTVLYNPLVIKPQVIPQPKLPEDAIRFLFMGRLGRRKGVYDIISAAKQLRHPQIRILLYGDGDVKHFQQLVAKEGLENRISVSTWIAGAEKEAAFRSADVVLLPSYREGLPMSVLEALSYGLPVIATPVGGTAEAVEDGVNGFLVQPGDVNLLANRIEQLAHSFELRQTMGQAGYEKAREKFNLPIIIGQLNALHAQLLENPSPVLEKAW